MNPTFSIAWRAAAVATLALCAGASAQAQSAGSIGVRAGATLIMPSVNSGDLSAPSLAGTKVDVTNAAQVSGGISYSITDNLVFDVPLALPFKHKIEGAGAIAGTGKLADVKALPVTLLLQWRFGAANASWRPFVSAGVVHARFGDSKATAALSGLTGGTPSNPTTLALKNATGPALQVGVVADLQGPWGLAAEVTKARLKTQGRLSTGQTIDVRLDPLAVAVGVSYRFR
jgi:outer membrane protein